MRTYEMNLTVKSNKEYDVIVVGGGPAGCAAAAASARDGAKTLLIESTSALGGMGTMGLIPAWAPFSDHEKCIYCGIGEKVFTKTKSFMDHINKSDLDWVPIDPERLKVVYDELMDEFHVDVLFNSIVCEVSMQDKKNIDALFVANKAGITAYQAKVYVDCTADADLIHYADAPFMKGNEDGGLQPGTLCFILSNVDENGYRSYSKIHGDNPKSEVHQILRSGKYPLIIDRHFCNSIIGPSTVGFNAGHMYVDGTDPLSLSKALIHGRKQARQIQEGMKEFLPKAFANSFLATTASLLGIRETRRIIGDYQITALDYDNRASFPDEIGRNCYYIDVHLTEKEREMQKKGLLNNEKRTRAYQKGESHGIPYRCLVPKDLDNVIVAGRSISTDRMIQGSTRVMPTCFVTGEAAGCAAALSAKTQKTTNMHEIDVPELRKTLKKHGAFFL